MLSIQSLLSLVHASCRQRYSPKRKVFILPCISLALHMFSCMIWACDFGQDLYLSSTNPPSRWLTLAAASVQVVQFRRTSSNSMGPPCCLIPRSACIIFLLPLLTVQMVATWAVSLARCTLLGVRIIPALWGDKPTELVRFCPASRIQSFFAGCDRSVQGLNSTTLGIRRP